MAHYEASEREREEDEEVQQAHKTQKFHQKWLRIAFPLRDEREIF